ncbi:5-methylaminomethyl-2-thiouridylate-methyltransferase [Punctularia strigosozonata HHB-11173 SS5]|uniref:5-methylaminomethyl-2-thiouridylate- methyltransferase n=1 Tax=Punctularia strigosozonata (strain HHB-11173) TaxID=741275 RepID=UPI0004417062|nr:5-methylaminomethyl-2-thiouridylate-methyltransferase [Punctularia strigosozonata HHB-11173 SS5]EIN07014.1 5-methylaminomethyl-2-thiouridylate-methyltransferase [Punctularia strigosozonata HHB-11173 SS5]
MSGGVDSSVTAKLLADQDYDLSAVFMRNWDTRDETGTDRGCEWEKDWEDVQRVCKALGIPCDMIDLSREYWTRVFEPSLEAWQNGVTPNPDVWCNKEVKFGALTDHLPPSAWIATGHYARKSWHPVHKRPQLLRCADRRKDQTYFLASVSETGLERALFPIAHLKKDEVREIAKQAGLHTAEREESMGICFVGEKRRFSDFITQYIPPCPGPVIHEVTGKRLGSHQGLMTYTIGENWRASGMVERMFVSRKDTKNNTIYAVPGSNHPFLFVDAVTTNAFSWIWADCPPPEIHTPDGYKCRMQLRHKMDSVPCTVRARSEGRIRISLDEPLKAAAEGQVVVLWDDDWCLGCGVITRTSRAQTL